MTPDFISGLWTGCVCCGLVFALGIAASVIWVERIVRRARTDIEELAAALGGAMDENRKLRDEILSLEIWRRYGLARLNGTPLTKGECDQFVAQLRPRI